MASTIAHKSLYLLNNIPADNISHQNLRLCSIWVEARADQATLNGNS
jgi:hypothetical protein